MLKQGCNEDWEATCAIFGIEPDEDQSMDIPLKSRNLVFCQAIDTSQTQTQNNNHNDDNTLCDPKFRLSLLNDDASWPVINVQFIYDQEYQPVSIEISWKSYPPQIPDDYKQQWMEWIQHNALQVLQQDMISYAVCDFVQHRSYEFYDHILDEYDVIMVVSLQLRPDKEPPPERMYPEPKFCPPHLRQEIIAKPKVPKFFHWRLQARLASHAERSRSKALLTSVVQRAKQILDRHWKKWYSMRCPICLDDDIMVADMAEITCGHLYCKDCIGMYCSGIVGELREQKRNPFICPMPKCRQEMKLVGCVKKIVTDDEMDAVHFWYKNVMNPLSQSLNECPRKSCRGKHMRKTKRGSHWVYCEDCSHTWCEHCLLRIRDDDPHDDCDPTDVILLVTRYDSAKPGIRAKCEARWPWIKNYASNMLDDVLIMKWMADNGMKCPSCKIGIERSEGCFHMTCWQCGTHFCYECGTELFAPFYGTHHCWEEQQGNDNDNDNDNGIRIAANAFEQDDW